MRAAVLVFLMTCVAAPVLADPLELTGDTDYDPHSQSWNGMASFVGLAQGMGFTVDAVTSLEWSELGAEDILVLVYPTKRVDPTRLGAFIKAGGHAVIADDFGDGKEAMQALGLLRAEIQAPRASLFHEGLPWAPIAVARGDHPIARDLGEIVTNHPAALTDVEGATVVAGFDDGAVVVAGERGNGRFVAISDPSVLINRMQQFRGNVQLAVNMLRWLDRDGRARRVVLLEGDVAIYGDPRSYIDDARAGEVGRSVASFNFWLSEMRAWLLTPAAMKALAASLATLLLFLALFALPIRRGPKIDGAWLRFGRPARRDEPHRLVSAAEAGGGSNLVLACILRDQVQTLLAARTGRPEPLHTVPETQLVGEVSKTHGMQAGAALSRVYKRLRALPSRSQAAAPWSSGHLTRREFDTLYQEVGELCRTLDADLPSDQ
ncbi:MAG: DUF4350 domain-containing protein [Kofleriaceae bacterium]